MNGTKARELRKWAMSNDDDRVLTSNLTPKQFYKQAKNYYKKTHKMPVITHKSAVANVDLNKVCEGV